MSTDDDRTKTNSMTTPRTTDVLAWITYFLLASWITTIVARYAMSLPSAAIR